MERYMNLVPLRNEKVQLRKINGKYYLLIPMDSTLDFLARKLHGEYRRIELDEIGAYTWELCDGRKTVREIGKFLKARFGDEVEPLYQRLVTFLIELGRRYLVEFKSVEEDILGGDQNE
ncbi:MAG TPA: PqqD family protein [Thermococcus paralvinellae]|uniref:PqqD family protein n=1 Tax=Thermococcus paralvinellae TaxID=582419 RepID=A0A832Z9G2_9EURY|nr:PqqD family protein [Thermococcus paralvinellae]HIP88497.1 PqqD family protein [Thermococcus paralvinellae]